MMSIESIILFFQNYPIIITFLGAFFGGEETILILAFFSGQEIFNFTTVFTFSVLGTIASDTVWYFLGKHGVGRWIEKSERFNKNYKKVERVVEKVSNNNHFLTLLYTKFLYGTRIITIMYLSKEKLSFKEFSKINTLTILPWAFIVVGLGHYVGGIVPSVKEGVENAGKVLLAIVVFLVITLISRGFFNKFLVKKVTG